MRSKAIREKIAGLVAEANALVKLAEKEQRELTDEESARIDTIRAEIGEDGEKPTGLYAQLKSATWLDEETQRQRQLLNNVGPQAGDPPADPPPKPAVISGIRYGKLRAFRGERAEEKAYRSGRFLAAVLYGDSTSAEWCQQHGIDIRAALSTGDNAKGGFLVPDEFLQSVIDLREQYGVFRRNVRVVPMGSDHMNIPRRLSGLTAYAVNDNQEITASDKQWNNVELTAKKWAAMCRYSSELADDAFISLADDLADEMAYAFARKEDECGFIGDGTSTYHGIQGIAVKIGAAGIATAAGGNTSFETLDLADFEAAVAKLPQYAIANAKWYISQAGYWASMARLMDAAGGNTITTLSGGPRQLMFLGFPVEITQVLNSTLGADTSAVKALFGDLRLSSTMGERRGFSVMQSADRYFEFDQIGIRATSRFAINNHDVGDASTAGPVVALKTAAS